MTHFLAQEIDMKLQHFQRTLQQLLAQLQQSLQLQQIQTEKQWLENTILIRNELHSWQIELLNATEVYQDISKESSHWMIRLQESIRLKSIHEESFRKMGLQFKEQLKNDILLKKQDLFSKQEPSEIRQRKEIKKNGPISTISPSSETEKSLKIASEATESLQRMNQMMATELEKSSTNMSALDFQTRLLKSTEREYGTLTAVLRSSKQLLTQLEQRDRTDKLLIVFACLVFGSVVLYILKKRVFWWLF